MIRKNEQLLTEMRKPGPCGICGKPCLVRQPDHIQPRGFGGGYRLDIRINLLPLGPAFTCSCHTDRQRHRIPDDVAFGFIARREGTTVEAIRAAIAWLNRADDGWSAERLEEEICKVPADVQALIRRELKG